MDKYKDEILKLIEEEGNEHRFIYKNVNCLLYRHDNLLHWCGYVDLPKDCKVSIDDISAHGGVNFDSVCDGVRRIGFDCGHGGDLSPWVLVSDFPFFDNSVYRDKEYVIREVKDMADQILKIDGVKSSVRNDTLKKLLNKKY
jgi:hypothetical protein